jgi:hypothetical protein
MLKTVLAIEDGASLGNVSDDRRIGAMKRSNLPGAFPTKDKVVVEGR